MRSRKERPRGVFKVNDRSSDEDEKGPEEYVYRAGAEAKEAKRPIRADAIEKLWLAVEDYLGSRVPQTKSDTTRIRREYLCQRRLVTLILLQETGLRPGELCEMRVDHQKNVLEKRKIYMITLKRGDMMLRDVTCSLEASLAILKLIQLRLRFIATLNPTLFARASEADRLFLTMSGQSLTVPTLEKEFWRIAVSAGLNKEACMSMFRHRFITRRIAMRVIDNQIELPVIDDKRTVSGDLIGVLATTAIETGHKDWRSLLHYCSSVNDELGLTKNADALIDLDRELNSIRLKIRRLEELISDPKADKEELFKRLASELDATRSKIDGQLRKLL